MLFDVPDSPISISPHSPQNNLPVKEYSTLAWNAPPQCLLWALRSWALLKVASSIKRGIALSFTAPSHLSLPIYLSDSVNGCYSIRESFPARAPPRPLGDVCMLMITWLISYFIDSTSYTQVPIDKKTSLINDRPRKCNDRTSPSKLMSEAISKCCT